MTTTDEFTLVEEDEYQPADIPRSLNQDLNSPNPGEVVRGVFDLYSGVMGGLGVGFSAQDHMESEARRMSETPSMSPWSAGEFAPPAPAPNVTLAPWNAGGFTLPAPAPNVAQQADAAASQKYKEHYNILQREVGNALGLPPGMERNINLGKIEEMDPELRNIDLAKLPYWEDLRQEEFGKSAGVDPIPTGLKYAATVDAAYRDGLMLIPNTLTAIADISQIPKALDVLEFWRPYDKRWQKDLEGRLKERADKSDLRAQQNRAMGAVGPTHDFASAVTRGLVEAPVYMAGGVGKAGLQALKWAAGGTGVATGGQRYARDRGEGRSQLGALPGAVATGSMEAGVMRAFGLRGLESIFKKQGPMKLGERVRDVAIQAGWEIPEEMTATIGGMIVDRVDKGISPTFNEAVYSVLLSGAVAPFVTAPIVGARHAVDAVRDRRAKKVIDELERQIRINSAERLSPDEKREKSILERMKQEGQLTLHDDQRLTELTKQDGLPFSRRELEIISEEAAKVGVPVEVITDPDESLSGGIAVYRDGKILINPNEAEAALDGLNEEQRVESIRAVMSEETIHSFADDAVAARFRENATGLDKFIGLRRYTGTLSGKTIHGQTISDRQLGHEMLRLQVQRLQKMTANEIAQHIRSKRLVPQLLVATENMLFSIRKAMRTKASKVQVAMVNNVIGKIEAAKAMVEAGVEEQPEMANLDPENAPFAMRQNPDFSEYQNRVSQLKSLKMDPSNLQQSFAQRQQLAQSVEDIKNKWGGKIPPETIEGEDLASMRQGEPSDVVKNFAEEFAKPPESFRITNISKDGSKIGTVATGLQLKSIADLDAMLELNNQVRGRMNALMKKMGEGKVNAEELGEIQMLAGRVQFPREVIEAATNSGSWVEGTDKYNELGPRPLDRNKNPEVDQWLKDHAKELSSSRSEGLAATRSKFSKGMLELNSNAKLARQLAEAAAEESDPQKKADKIAAVLSRIDRYSKDFEKLVTSKYGKAYVNERDDGSIGLSLDAHPNLNKFIGNIPSEDGIDIVIAIATLGNARQIAMGLAEASVMPSVGEMFIGKKSDNQIEADRIADDDWHADFTKINTSIYDKMVYVSDLTDPKKGVDSAKVFSEVSSAKSEIPGFVKKIESMLSEAAGEDVQLKPYLHYFPNGSFGMAYEAVYKNNQKPVITKDDGFNEAMESTVFLLNQLKFEVVKAEDGSFENGLNAMRQGIGKVYEKYKSEITKIESAIDEAEESGGANSLSLYGTEIDLQALVFELNDILAKELTGLSLAFHSGVINFSVESDEARAKIPPPTEAEIEAVADIVTGIQDAFDRIVGLNELLESRMLPREASKRFSEKLRPIINNAKLAQQTVGRILEENDPKKSAVHAKLAQAKLDRYISDLEVAMQDATGKIWSIKWQDGEYVAYNEDGNELGGDLGDAISAKYDETIFPYEFYYAIDMLSEVRKNLEENKGYIDGGDLAAMRQGGPSQKAQRLAEQARRIAELQAKARGEELPEELRSKPQIASGSFQNPVPASERVSAEAAGALPRLGAKELDAKAAKVLMTEAKVKPKKYTEKQIKGDRFEYERPAFDDFAEWARKNVQGVNDEQIRDIWEDQVWSMLIKADGPRLESLRKAFGLEDTRRTKMGLPQRTVASATSAESVGQEQRAQGLQNILAQASKLEAKAVELEQAARSSNQGRASGELDLFSSADEAKNMLARAAALRKRSDEVSALARKATERSLPKSVLKLSRSDQMAAKNTQNYRLNVISRLATEMIGESMQGRPSLERQSVSIDDIDFSTERSYWDITADDLKLENRKRLLVKLRDQARGLSGDPESASRRLVAVVDDKGQVYLLTTYNDAGTQRIADPAGPVMKGKPSREMTNLFLRQYRPIATLLLESPVKGLRQKFDTVSEFMDEIGKEASERSKIGSYEFVPEGPPDPDFEVDVPDSGKGGEGIEGEGGSFMGPAKKLYVSSARGTALQSVSPLTLNESKALVKLMRAEVGRIESEDDIVAAIEGMTDLAKRGKLTGAKLTAVGALRKIFIKSQLANPEMSSSDIARSMAQKVFAGILSGRTAAESLTAEFSRMAANPVEMPNIGNLPQALQTETGTRGRQVWGPMRTTDPKAGRAPLQFEPARLGETPEGDRAKLWTARNLYLRTLKNRGRKMSLSSLANLVGVSEEYLQYHKEVFDPEWKVNRAPRMDPLGEQKFPLLSLRSKAKRGALKLNDIVRDLGSSYDEWMVDRIERMGGLETKALAVELRKIISEEKGLYGSLTPSLDRARILAGGGREISTGTGGSRLRTQVPNIENIRAAKWLSELGPVTPMSVHPVTKKPRWGRKGRQMSKWAAVANVVGAIEGSTDVPGFARAVVAAAQQSNLEAGLLLQPVIKGFKATGKFSRNVTAVAYDAIRSGQGRLFNKWTTALAYANDRPIHEVRKMFREFKELLDKPTVDSDSIDKVNQDFTRLFPRTVTHIKHLNVWIPMLHTDLFNYLENTARRASHIRAFRNTFRNNPKGKKLLQDALNSSKSEMGSVGQTALRTLIRTSQGVPSDNYSNWGGLAPTTLTGIAFKEFNATIGNLMAKLVLSGQMFVQPGETVVGATPVFLGFKNQLRAAARLRELYPMMEQQGMVNRVIHNFSYDSASPIKSGFRIAGNVIGKVFMEQTLNELQEALAAATAHVVAERITSGDVSAWEKRMLPETFKAMGFPEADVQALMNGDTDLLWQFKRKAAAFLTSGNRAISEGSGLSANRLFNTVFRFQSYPMMKMNQFRRLTSSLIEAWADGTGREKRNATEIWARFMFGGVAQGAITAAITTLAYSGVGGLKIMFKEAEDDPLEFILDAWMHTISGPMLLVWRGLTQNLGGIGENVTRMMFPYSSAKELFDFSTGAGRYRDRSVFDRIGEFINAKVPGTKAIGTGLAVFGLSEEDKNLEAALNGFYRWRRKTKGWKRVQTFLEEDNRSEFRKEMKKALEALKTGDEDAFYKHLDAADDQLIDIESDEKARSSFGDYMVLVGPKGDRLTEDDIDELRLAIGDEPVERLLYFEGMLKEAGLGKFTPKYD